MNTLLVSIATAHSEGFIRIAECFTYTFKGNVHTVALAEPNTQLYVRHTGKKALMMRRAHTFLADERQRPREHVHEVGQPVRMRGAVELPYVHDVVFVLQHSSLVVGGGAGKESVNVNSN